MDGFKHFLTHRGVLFTLPWLYAVLAIADCTVGGILTPEAFGVRAFAFEGIAVALALAILFSYRAHEKNVMKALLGALLTERLLAAVTAFCERLEGDIFRVVIAAALVAGYALLFVDHVYLGAGHNPKPAAVRFNWACGALLVLLSIGSHVLFYFDTLCLPVAVLGVLAEAFAVLFLLSVETTVDAFKASREQSRQPDGFDGEDTPKKKPRRSRRNFFSTPEP